MHVCVYYWRWSCWVVSVCMCRVVVGVALHAMCQRESLTRVRAQATFSSSTTMGRTAGMPKFTTLKGVAAPLDIQNIDTDMIIPKQYLKTIKRSGLGVGLFSEMRYLNQDTTQPNPDFVLNQDKWKEAKVLVAGNNFGCGSSREHAPWAINDFGIRAIIASGFADIFFGNCFKNGMLPVVLPEEEVRKCMAEASAGNEIEIDLPNQVRLSRPANSTCTRILTSMRTCKHTRVRARARTHTHTHRW